MSTLIQFIFICAMLFSLASILWSTIRYGISPMPSNQKAQLAMLSLIPDNPPTHMVDLGSGWGTIAHQLAKRYPQSTVYGYERSLIPFLFSRLFFRRNNLHLYFANFLQEQFPPHTLFFCYLYPQGMSILSNHLNGLPCQVISNTFALGQHQPIRTLQIDDSHHSKIYLYDLK